MIQNCTRQQNSNCYCKCKTLSTRQVCYILLVPVSGILTGATTILNAIGGFRRGTTSKTLLVSLIVSGVALIILGTLLTIIYILYKRNKALRRSLDIEKIRFYSTIMEQDRQKMRNKIKKVERNSDATILPDRELLVNNLTSSFIESDTIQEHKTSVVIESKI